MMKGDIMNKKVLFIFLCALLAVTSMAFGAPADIDMARDTGEIRGVISYCGLSNLEGTVVFIPGKSFSARTDTNGSFSISYVPVGTWNLGVTYKGQLIGTISGVQVTKRQATDLGGRGALLCLDIDGDTYTIETGDCNEANPRVYPGAPEFCGDALDNNCNGLTDESCPECTDSDGDGFYAQGGCGITDCDETNPGINPGALESCGDGVDNDCDTQVDEPDAYNASTFYYDGDGDGYGNNANTTTACSAPEGYIASGGDCDDTHVLIHPGGLEKCNGIDDNCDGLVDNECTNRVCTDQEVADVEACLNGCVLPFFQCAQVCGNLVSPECGSALFQLYTCAGNEGCLDLDPQDAQICMYNSCPAEWEEVFGNTVPTP